MFAFHEIESCFLDSKMKKKREFGSFTNEDILSKLFIVSCESQYFISYRKLYDYHSKEKNFTFHTSSM